MLVVILAGLAARQITHPRPIPPTSKLPDFSDIAEAVETQPLRERLAD